MRKGDIIWGLCLLIWIAIIAIPVTRIPFINFTTTHSYIGSFIKFSILATMGDLVGFRIANGYYKKPIGMIYKAIVWGLIGMSINLMITVFRIGVLGAQEVNLLPLAQNILGTAILTSAAMHITFSTAMFLFHRLSDVFIDLKIQNKPAQLKNVIAEVNWQSYVSFSVFKTIPFFWIPCHTIVFLLPGEYRILASAGLSIALGLLLGIANSKSRITNP